MMLECSLFVFLYMGIKPAVKKSRKETMMMPNHQAATKKRNNNRHTLSREGCLVLLYRGEGGMRSQSLKPPSFLPFLSCPAPIPMQLALILIHPSIGSLRL